VRVRRDCELEVELAKERARLRQELAGVQLDGQLFTVFTIRDGQIVHLHDHAHRAEDLVTTSGGRNLPTSSRIAPLISTGGGGGSPRARLS
jgi:hypothetical protein